MQAPDPIETILARLMPTALSFEGQARLDEMIDDFAEESITAAPNRVNWIRWVAGGGIAAGIGAVFAIVSLKNDFVDPLNLSSLSETAGLVLVSNSARIESMTDEGWQEDFSGIALHAVRLNVVEENSLRDEETGMVVQISQPREEMLFMPISSF